MKILDIKWTNSDNLENRTNSKTIPNNQEKGRRQEQDLTERQVPEKNLLEETQLSQNKEHELQTKLTKLDQRKVREVYDEVDDWGQEFKMNLEIKSCWQ